MGLGSQGSYHFADHPSVARLVNPEPLDDFGKMWLYLMRGIDNSPLSQAEKLGCLEFVKHEMLTRMMASQSDNETQGV